MRVLKEFPQGADILNPGTEEARPDIVALRNNNNFRHDISRYQEDLREGRHDPEWISQAQAAHRKRALGVYDDFLARKFEEDWGIPMPSLSADGSLDTPLTTKSLSTSQKLTPRVDLGTDEQALQPSGSQVEVEGSGDVPEAREVSAGMHQNHEVDTLAHHGDEENTPPPQDVEIGGMETATEQAELVS